jgi:hypothetical protein
MMVLDEPEGAQRSSRNMRLIDRLGVLDAVNIPTRDGDDRHHIADITNSRLGE